MNSIGSQQPNFNAINNNQDPSLLGHSENLPPLDIDALQGSASLQELLAAVGMELTKTGEMRYIDGVERVGSASAADVVSEVIMPDVALNTTEAEGLESFMHSYNQVSEMMEGPDLASTASFINALGIDAALLEQAGAFINGPFDGSTLNFENGAQLNEVDLQNLQTQMNLEGQTLSADQMMAAFLALNLTDPNNSAETHSEIAKAAGDLRKSKISQSRADAKIAYEKQEIAMEKAQKTAKLLKVLAVVMIVVSIVTTVVGVGAVFGAVAAGLIAKATVDTILIVAAVITLAAGVTKAVDKKNLADKELSAEKSAYKSEESEKKAEEALKVMEDEGALIALLLELRGKLMDAVMGLLSANHATTLRTLSIQA